MPENRTRGLEGDGSGNKTGFYRLYRYAIASLSHCGGLIGLPSALTMACKV